MTDEEQRIAEAEAKLEQLERAREERAAKAAKARRLEDLERSVADAEAIAKAEEDLGVGKFAAHRTPLGVVIVKRPNHMHYRKFVSLKEHTPDDAERLVLQCLVHPSKGAFQQISEEYPAAMLKVAELVVDLAAGRVSEVSGKS